MVTEQGRKLTDREVAKLEERLRKILVRSGFEALIATGQVDPSGKSEAELQRALLLRLRDVVPKHGGFNLIVDHRTSLLQQGREFARRGKAELAILFYATWFEHWINSLLNIRGHLVGLQPKEIQLCLPQIGLEAKFICFPLYLKFPRLAASHIATVRDCSPLRNALVHYKFPVGLSDEEDKEDDELKKALTAGEKTVRYLCNYEQLHIFKRIKKLVKKLANPPGKNSK